MKSNHFVKKFKNFKSFHTIKNEETSLTGKTTEFAIQQVNLPEILQEYYDFQMLLLDDDVNSEEKTKKILTYIEKYPKSGLLEFNISVSTRYNSINKFIEIFSKLPSITRDYAILTYKFPIMFYRKVFSQHLVSESVTQNKDFVENDIYYVEWERDRVVEAIIDDDVQFFINMSTENPDFSAAEYTIIIPLMKNSSIELICAAAIFRATKIFKWCLVNDITIDSYMVPPALHGGSNEIVRLIEQNNVSMKEFASFALYNRNDDIYDWISEGKFTITPQELYNDDLSDATIKAVYGIFQVYPGKISLFSFIMNAAMDGRNEIAKLFLSKNINIEKLFTFFRDPDILNQILKQNNNDFNSFFIQSLELRSMYHVKFIILHPECNIEDLDFRSLDLSQFISTEIRQIVMDKLLKTDGSKFAYTSYKIFKEIEPKDVYKAISYAINKEDYAFIVNIMENHISALSKDEIFSILVEIQKKHDYGISNDKSDNKTSQIVNKRSKFNFGESSNKTTILQYSNVSAPLRSQNQDKIINLLIVAIFDFKISKEEFTTILHCITRKICSFATKATTIIDGLLNEKDYYQLLKPINILHLISLNPNSFLYSKLQNFFTEQHYIDNGYSFITNELLLKHVISSPSFSNSISNEEIIQIIPQYPEVCSLFRNNVLTKEEFLELQNQALNMNSAIEDICQILADDQYKEYLNVDQFIEKSKKELISKIVLTDEQIQKALKQSDLWVALTNIEENRKRIPKNIALKLIKSNNTYSLVKYLTLTKTEIKDILPFIIKSIRDDVLIECLKRKDFLDEMSIEQNINLILDKDGNVDHYSSIILEYLLKNRKIPSNQQTNLIKSIPIDSADLWAIVFENIDSFDASGLSTITELTGINVMRSDITFNVDSFVQYLKSIPNDSLEIVWNMKPSKYLICNSFVEIAKTSNTQLLKILLDHGAEIDFINSNGETALHNAIQNGILPTVKFLVENGAYTGFLGDSSCLGYIAHKINHKLLEYLLDILDLKNEYLYYDIFLTLHKNFAPAEMIEKIKNELGISKVKKKPTKTTDSRSIYDILSNEEALRQCPTDKLVDISTMNRSIALNHLIIIKKELLKRDIPVKQILTIINQYHIKTLPSDASKMAVLCFNAINGGDSIPEGIEDISPEVFNAALRAENYALLKKAFEICHFDIQSSLTKRGLFLEFCANIRNIINHGNASIIQLLLDNKMDVNMIIENTTLLNLSILQRARSIFDLIIRYKPNFKQIVNISPMAAALSIWSKDHYYALTLLDYIDFEYESLTNPDIFKFAETKEYTDDLAIQTKVRHKTFAPLDVFSMF